MKNRLALALTFLLCISVLAFSLIRNVFPKTESYDIVFFGDSIIAGDHNISWTIPAMLMETTGKDVLNAAVGGSTLCDVSSTKKVGDCSPLFSLVALAKSIRDDDYSLQLLGSQKDNLYIDEWRYKVTSELCNVDWNKADYIIIEQGANDYLTGVQIDDPIDLYNESTFAGALRLAIEILEKKAPKSKIILMTPIYIFPDGYDKDCMEMDFGGGTLDAYVEKEIEVAKEYGAILIDNFHELNIDRDNYQSYIPGGLHGNYNGNKLITDNIVKHLKELDEGN